MRRVDELVASISEANREQSEGLAQLNSVVGLMDATTQSNAASAEESASAAEELSAQAQSLRTSVVALRILIDGRLARSLPDRRDVRPTLRPS